MHSMKFIGWVVGLLTIGAAVSNTPAYADQNQSDTSGTNVFNQTDVLFGFEPLTNTQEIDGNLQSAITSVVALTGGSGQNGIATTTRNAVTSLANGTQANGTQGNNTQGNNSQQNNNAQGQTDREGTTSQEETLGLVNSPSNRDNAVGVDSADISPETRTALLELAERLQDIESGLWAYGDALDQSIRDSAKGLSRDLADARAACQASAATCGRLNRLAVKIRSFTQNLETLRTSMDGAVQKARIY